MMFQSPRGDFGFLKTILAIRKDGEMEALVSIPSRGFWFFEVSPDTFDGVIRDAVSIPSRGFWFFEEQEEGTIYIVSTLGFNPLAGILVF